MRRKVPEYVNILNVDCLDDAIDLCLFAFKEYAEKYRFFNYKKQNLRESKYFKFFFELTLEVCKFVYSIDSSVKLMNYEFSKICLDWFVSFQEVSTRMRKGKFFLNQIASEFAKEVFIEYIAREYGDPVAYIDAIKPKMKKLRRENIKEEIYEEALKSIGFKKNKQIKGLTEVIF